MTYIKRFCAASGLVFGALWLSVPGAPEAGGCGGTPPPIECGITYNFACAGVLQRVASDLPQVMTIDTVHYLGFVGFTHPDAPYTVNMTVDLACTPGPSGGPQSFGPFTVDPGQNCIPIGVQVAGGPPRQCTATVTTNLTLVDGSEFQQQSSVLMCLGADANDDGQPDIEITPVGGNVNDLPPGGTVIVEYVVTNHLGQSASCEAIIETSNGSKLASTLAGTSAVQAFATADPVGDAFQTGTLGDVVNGCLPDDGLPPHMRLVGTSTQTIDLAPGESKNLCFAISSKPVCGNGKCDQALISVYQTDVPASAGMLVACANLVPIVNFGLPGSRCAGSGLPTTTHPTGGAGFSGVGLRVQGSSPEQQIEFDVSGGFATMVVNGIPVSSTTFSSIGFIEQFYGRIGVFYFPPPFPSDSLYEFDVTVDLRASPDSSGIEPTINEIHVHGGAPTRVSNAQESTVTTGVIGIDPGETGGDPKEVRFIQQVSTFLTTTSGTPFEGRIDDFSIVDVTSDRITYNIKTSLPPGTTEEFISNVTVHLDYRGYAGDPVDDDPPFGDMNCDGSFDIFDLGAFVLAVTDPEGYAMRFPGCDPLAEGDYDDDGVLDADDYADLALDLLAAGGV